MRAHKLMLAGFPALLLLLALNVAPAVAKTGYTNLCPALGTALCTPGMAEYLDFGVAVDNSSGPSAGDVWFESGPEEYEVKLVKFDASGNELGEINNSNIPGSAVPFGRGESGMFGVAVDSNSGDVYVSDHTNIVHAEPAGTVTKFDASGVFQFQVTGSETPQGAFSPYGVAVDASNGDFYVADVESSVIDKFSSSGSYLGQFATPATPIATGDTTLAVGPEGNLYVGAVGKVGEYSPSGVPVDCPGGSNVLPVQGSEGTIAIDPSDGHIFVEAANASNGVFIAEYSSLCATSPDRTLGRNEFAYPTPMGKGLGVSASTHEVYASHFDASPAGFGGAPGLVFGLVTVPTVTTAASATGISRFAATVSGTVNPEGTSVTTCEFEYGSTPAYGSSVPCEQTLPLEGSAPVTVSAEIKSSEPPASLVYYRLKAASSAGEEVGAGEVFRLEVFPPPVVGGLPASNVTQFGATLNGTLQTGEALVNYRFEYGTSTAYGAVEPIPDGYTPITAETVPVSQPVGSLQAGTTYHYRLVASSPGGTEVRGPDETFTTLPVPVPTVETGGASGVGVGAATLVGTIDPHGWDTTYLFQYGTSTAYGSSWPTVQVDMGALEGFQPVVVGIPNLLPSTTYHYRLVASNGGGTTYGQDMTFTTGEYPAAIVQEPVGLRTLLVPSDKAAKSTAKNAKKGKKGKKAKKRRRTKHVPTHTKTKGGKRRR